MKPWKPCEHCYLRDKYCENAEREQPCVPVQEYLESTSEIKRLQNLLEMSENEHYKTLQQLSIATKALREYANEENWRTATTIINTDYFEFEYSMYGLKDSGFEEAQKALKEIDLVGTSVSLTKEKQ